MLYMLQGCTIQVSLGRLASMIHAKHDFLGTQPSANNRTNKKRRRRACLRQKDRDERYRKPISPPQLPPCFHILRQCPRIPELSRESYRRSLYITPLYHIVTASKRNGCTFEHARRPTFIIFKLIVPRQDDDTISSIHPTISPLASIFHSLAASRLHTGRPDSPLFSRSRKQRPTIAEGHPSSLQGLSFPALRKLISIARLPRRLCP